MSKLFRQLKRSINKALNTEYRKRTGKRDWKYELSELKYAFLETALYSWLTPITVFYESCERVIQWIPILWKDRDWVDNYIFMILRYRIKRARHNMTEYSYYANADEYSRQMRIAELLLERLEKPDNYSEKDWEDHFKQWPHGRNCYLDENGYAHFSGYKPGEREDIKRINDKEEYMWRQDFEYLMNHMRKHVRKWGS